MRNFLIIILLASAFVSCEETIELDLDQTEPKVVIEGLVTNMPGNQSVKVSRSASFYSSGQTPKITNAVVTVEDGTGEAIMFVHNPNSHPDSLGIYVPSSEFVGVIGRTYTLTVEVEGKTYEATDLLAPIITMDSLKYQINDDQVEDPNEEGKIYELLMYAREPQDQSNFYLFKFYRNDSLIYFNDTDIYYSDDELLAEKIDGVPSPVYYGVGDTGKVEVYSLSRRGYVFYNDLWSNLNNDGGGMFGPIPSSPRTNLTNGALGFFQVSAVDVSETTIE